MKKFMLVKKIKSKVYGVAESDGECMSQADNNFYNVLKINQWTEGYRVSWADNITSQKNYGGLLPEFKSL